MASLSSDQLNKLYGACRRGERRQWEEGAAAIERHELSHQTANWLISILQDSTENPIVFRLAVNCSMLWALDTFGVIFVCVEQSCHTDSPDNRFARTRNVAYAAGINHLGHPLLVDEAGARIAGELYLDNDSEGNLVWVLNNKSGRFGYDRTHEQLNNVALRFAEVGVFVKLDHRV